MARDPSEIRWLGLEIGPYRYAVDLHEVSLAIVWPNKVVTCTRGLPNAQGLFVHEGRPIVVVAPDALFSGVSNTTGDFSSPLIPASNSWLVVFRATPGVAACGLRVDRTVGPFRVAAANDTEVEYSAQRWRIVSAAASPMSSLSNSSAGEILP